MNIKERKTVVGAVDLGYGWTKAKVDGGKPWRQPSVVGEPKRIYQADILEKDVRYHTLIRPEQVEGQQAADPYLQVKYFVGDLALRKSTIKYAGVGKDKAKDFHTKILLETALGAIAPDVNLNLVTGLPWDFYNGQKADMEALLDDFNSGDIFGVQHGNGTPIQARPSIKSFKIVPQHLGGLMHHILNDQGEEKEQGALSRYNWLVIDPGRFTLGLLGMERGQIMKESRSPDQGVEVAYDIIQEELRAQLGRTPDRFLLDSYVLAGEYDGIDLKPLRDYAFTAWANQIQLEIESFNRDFKGYIVVGGWAKEIAPKLKTPKDKTHAYGQWANLEGYIKIGKRTWRANM